MPTVVLLGPQRYHPTLAEAFQHVGVEGPVAAVTAGWEEREDEIDELSEHLGRDVVNLRLHGRTEHIFRRDEEFQSAWRERRLKLREARDIYRQRIGFQMDALRRMERRPDSELVIAEREHALQDVRDLDERQLERIDAIHAEFEARMKPAERKSVAQQRARVEELIGDCTTVAIAGGNVAVLRNRLRLFGLADLIGDRPLFAWSAGAMCATERIVTYHDSPPQGPADPLVLENGLGLCPRVIALPHAARRLDLADAERVALFTRRFLPRKPIALDDASGLIWEGDGWQLFGDGAKRLHPDGIVRNLREVEAA